MIPGYNGILLEVDLGREKWRAVELEEEVLEKYIGGRGLAAYLLWRELGGRWERVDPLGPENLLLFLTGPLTGYYPGSKLCISGKSPQTNGIVGSAISTEAAIELRAAGYDGIAIKGTSRDPVYLLVDGDKVEIRGASELWGLGGRETLLKLKKEVRKELSGRRAGIPRDPGVLYIGPAGENKVRTAVVMAKWTHAAGYGGYGAVMGAKRLKAVVVKGYGPMPPPKDPDKAVELLKTSWEILTEDRTALSFWGTAAGAYSCAYKRSAEPVRNWQEEWHDARQLGPQTFECYWIKRYWGDYGCPTTCMKISVIRRGEFRGAVTDAPDYEMQAYLGPNLGVFDPEGCIYLSYLADELGLCGINTGNVLGFAAELYERGILTREELGVDLRWGDARAFAILMEKIARREGIGDLLAEGTTRAAIELSKKKGVDLSRYVVQVKGAGVGAHGIRSGADYTQPISYACSTQGGDHTSPALLPATSALGELAATFHDSAVICSFNVPWGREELPFEFLRAITGWDLDIERWTREHGRRILTIQRVALLIGGPDLYWDPRVHDDNPPRFYEPLPTGPFAGKRVDRAQFAEEKREYYERLGWDEHGLPTRETLRELGLEFLGGAVELVGRRLGL